MSTLRKFAYAFLLILVTGCTSQLLGPPADAYQAEADSVIALAFAADPIDPGGSDSRPDDRPRPQPKPGDKCPQCDGSGRTGDGLGRCQKCGGDGRIDERDIREPLETASKQAPEPVPMPTAAPTPAAKLGKITLHITDENQAGWPVEWWRTVRPTIQAAWDVHVVKDVDPAAKTAWFEICTESGCHRVNRSLTPETLELILEVKNQKGQ